jgi:excisionase family DNA binding protein
VKNELTPNEASKHLGVGRLYVYELLACSRLKARKILGRWLISRRDVESYRRRSSKAARNRRAPKSTHKQRTVLL